MRLLRRGEGVFDADVELASAADCKPGAATRAQRLGLLELLQAEQIAENRRSEQAWLAELESQRASRRRSS